MHELSAPLTTALIGFMDFEDRAKLNTALGTALQGNMTAIGSVAVEHICKARVLLHDGERNAESFTSITKAVARAITALQSRNL